MNDKNEKWAKRIFTMLKMADEGGEDAANLMEMAKQLMEQHGISSLDVATADDPMGHGSVSATYAWGQRLCEAVARYYGGVTVRSPSLTKTGRRSQKATMLVVGTKSARITIELMWPYILKAVKREAKLLFETQDYHYRRSLPDITAQVGTALSVRILDLVKQREVPTTQTGTGVVLADQVMAYIEEIFPMAREVRLGSKGYSNAAAAAAGRISLNHQTGQSAGQTLLARTS